MIYDKISNFKNYKGMNKNLDKAFDFLEKLDLTKLEPGRFDIDGNNIYYMVQNYETIPVESGKYESHKKYIDIQLLTSGNEYIRADIYNNPEITVSYNQDNDIEFYKLDKGYDFLLTPETFTILMPGELHAPKLMVDKIENVTKIVVKILFS